MPKQKELSEKDEEKLRKVREAFAKLDEMERDWRRVRQLKKDIEEGKI